MKKTPCILFLGTRDQLIREGGPNNKDGWGFSTTPDNDRAPRPIAKPTLFSKVLFRR